MRVKKGGRNRGAEGRDVAGVDAGMGHQGAEAGARGLQLIYQEMARESDTVQKMEREVLPQVAGKRCSAMSQSKPGSRGRSRAAKKTAGTVYELHERHQRDCEGSCWGLGREGDTDSLEERGGQRAQRRATPATNHLVTIKSRHPVYTRSDQAEFERLESFLSA
ncbi:hypothetical protein B0H10DRAFT_1969108 [Mycena sp. CBHHK59/15]|nr:hypothetical protein B0H10DRAFT_1969108 [Mycena sp. CBHHK59/15]